MSEVFMTLRPAAIDDAAFVYRVANDPGTRQASFRGEPILWGGHLDWYAHRLADPRYVFLIVCVDSGSANYVRRKPAGYVRFALRDDEAGAEAEITIALAPEHRGRGLAARAIMWAMASERLPHSVRRVVAVIKPSNEASLRAFARVGFETESMEPGRVVMTLRSNPYLAYIPPT
ncbi:MAG: GNAT family N-acetyltransferase [Gemmatimonadales bacterium]|nr:GNAT family N-acetyltransferase [Gemmatimonadales bacterium]